MATRVPGIRARLSEPGCFLSQLKRSIFAGAHRMEDAFSLKIEGTCRSTRHGVAVRRREPKGLAQRGASETLREISNLRIHEEGDDSERRHRSHGRPGPTATQVPKKHLQPVGDRKPRSRKPLGLTIERHFTRAGEDPFDAVEWELRDASIGDEKGNARLRAEGRRDSEELVAARDERRGLEVLPRPHRTRRSARAASSS